VADKFAGIRLGKKTIEHSRDSRPKVGLSAAIVSGDAIVDRTELPGFVMLGGLNRLLLNKGIKSDEAYLVVRGPSFEWCVPLTADNIKQARVFAEKVNLTNPAP